MNESERPDSPPREGNASSSPPSLDPAPPEAAADQPPGPDPHASVDELAAYFAANRDRFTRGALISQAEAAGHSDVAIHEALAASEERAGRTRVAEMKELARRVTWLAYAIGFIVITVPLLLIPRGTGSLAGLSPMIFVAQLILTLIALAISLFAIRRRRGAPEGALGVASLLAVPAVIFIAFPGSCLYMWGTSIR